MKTWFLGAFGAVRRGEWPFALLMFTYVFLVIATFWLNYASARGDKDEHAAIRDGIVQVMMLMAPFLRDAERVHLNTLIRAYLD